MCLACRPYAGLSTVDGKMNSLRPASTGILDKDSVKTRGTSNIARTLPRETVRVRGYASGPQGSLHSE